MNLQQALGHTDLGRRGYAVPLALEISRQWADEPDTDRHDEITLNELRATDLTTLVALSLNLTSNGADYVKDFLARKAKEPIEARIIWAESIVRRLNTYTVRLTPREVAIIIDRLDPEDHRGLIDQLEASKEN